jgi:hypothetical protein
MVGMRVRATSKALILIAAILAAVALGWFGRTLVRHDASPEQVSESDAYFAGLRAGEAQGRQEGRAAQEGVALPGNSRQPVRDAFNAGYVAGANDAFAGYDGGWTTSVPYVVTLDGGSGQIVYRIDSRTPVEAHVNYYLCADGHDICQERRR